MSTSDPSPGWFRRNFNEDYRTIYSGRDQAQADIEVAFVLRELHIQPGELLLDLCCGFGRHLVAFARHGIAAVGVDLSPHLLRQVEPAPRRRVVCADMRALPFAGGRHGFAVLVNFFTSFGYFQNDEENVDAVREMVRVLRPGGRFCMDLMNAAATVRDLENRTEREAGSFLVREERRFDGTRRRVEKSITLLERNSGVRRQYFESIRLFSPAEITTLLERVGLEVDRMLGDFNGGPYCEQCPRMILLGRKRT